MKTLCLVTLLGIVTGCGIIEDATNNRDPQEGVTSINGRVVDRVTNQPIQGARVSTNPPTSEDITNSDGKFLLTDKLVPDTLYTVVASGTGYAQDTASVTVTDGENKVVNFNLQPTLAGGLEVNPAELNFGFQTNSLQINISSKFGEAMDFTINQPQDAWIQVQEPFTGSLTTQSLARMVTVLREGLAPGTHQTSFNVTSSTGSTVTVVARLTIQ